MKLSCSRKDLVEAIGFVVPISQSRSALPLLLTVKFEATADKLTLTACNGEMWAEWSLLANVSEPGTICIPGKVVQELVSSLPDGQVHLETTADGVVLRSGASDWKLVSHPSDHFPAIPDFETSSKVTLPAQELWEAIQSVSYAVSEDHIKVVLTGIHVRYDGQQLILAATDTHRLAIVKMTKEGLGSNVAVNVPGKAMTLVRSLPVAQDEVLSLEFDDTRLLVEAQNCRIVSQLLGGGFPDFERVIPTQHTRTWTLDRAEMIDNLKRVAILARDSAYRVRFGASADSVLISARSEDKGEAKEEVPAILENGEIEIAFNGKYVLDAMASFKSDAVVAEMTESMRPAVFRPTEDTELHRLCVIMPMALS